MWPLGRGAMGWRGLYGVRRGGLARMRAIAAICAVVHSILSQPVGGTAASRARSHCSRTGSTGAPAIILAMRDLSRNARLARSRWSQPSRLIIRRSRHFVMGSHPNSAERRNLCSVAGSVVNTLSRLVARATIYSGPEPASLEYIRPPAGSSGQPPESGPRHASAICCRRDGQSRPRRYSRSLASGSGSVRIERHPQ